jgi:hypothetical protein
MVNSIWRRDAPERMRASLGQPVIIENVVGAAGSIGVGRVARAAPDGYTLDLGQWGTHVLNGALYGLQYDLPNDFAPVALIADSPLLIVAPGGRRSFIWHGNAERVAGIPRVPLFDRLDRSSERANFPVGGQSGDCDGSAIN